MYPILRNLITCFVGLMPFMGGLKHFCFAYTLQKCNKVNSNRFSVVQSNIEKAEMKRDV